MRWSHAWTAVTWQCLCQRVELSAMAVSQEATKKQTKRRKNTQTARKLDAVLETFGVFDFGPRCAKDAPWTAPWLHNFERNQFKRRPGDAEARRATHLQKMLETSQFFECYFIEKKRKEWTFMDFWLFWTSPFWHVQNNFNFLSHGSWFGQVRELIWKGTWLMSRIGICRQRTENAWRFEALYEFYKVKCQMCHDTIRIFWTVSHKSELKGQGLCDIGNAGWKCLIDLSRLHPIRMKSQRVERISLRVKAIEKGWRW